MTKAFINQTQKQRQDKQGKATISYNLQPPGQVIVEESNISREACVQGQWEADVQTRVKDLPEYKLVY